MRLRPITSPNAWGIILTLLIAFLVQVLLLLFFLERRTQSLNEDTQSFAAVQLFDLADLVMRMDPQQRVVFMELANSPFTEIHFYKTLPERQPVSGLDWFLGINTRRTDVQLGPDLYMVLSRDQALRESYSFLWQIGALSVSFFLLLTLVLIRARAALYPVYSFARAAKRLSEDLHARPMRVKGSRDIRKAAVAMNAMQLALQEQVSARSQLIAGIGHDLRTYITRMNLRTELLDDQQIRERMLADLNAMTHVVNQSLEFGAADHSSEDLQQLDLANILFSIIRPYQETGQSVSMEPLDSVKAELRPTAFTRAIENLIENALRYGLKAHVSMQHEAIGKGQRVFIHIDDEGPGIPEDQRDEVLKPFVRLEASRNRDTGGTGLGLALALNLLKQQNARLSLNDAPSGGLRATIELAAV